MALLDHQPLHRCTHTRRLPKTTRVGRSAAASVVNKRQKLYYTDTPFPALGRKSSASARKWVDSIRHKTVDDLRAALAGGDRQILATSCSPEAKPLGAYDFTRPTAVIMGNEHGGVPEELCGLAHGEVYIPMYGLIPCSFKHLRAPETRRKIRRRCLV